MQCKRVGCRAALAVGMVFYVLPHTWQRVSGLALPLDAPTVTEANRDDGPWLPPPEGECFPQQVLSEWRCGDPVHRTVIIVDETGKVIPLQPDARPLTQPPARAPRGPWWGDHKRGRAGDR